MGASPVRTARYRLAKYIRTADPAKRTANRSAPRLCAPTKATEAALILAWERHLARKFLYLIAAIIFLILGAAIIYQLFPSWLARTALVPSTEFVEQEAPKANAYDNAIMWLAKPGMSDNPTDWRPTPAELEGDAGTAAAPSDGEALIGDAASGEGGKDAAGAAAKRPPVTDEQTPPPAIGPAAVFFVHPTSYYSRQSWNAPLADRDADHRANLFVRGMASAFADAGETWAPRYRQATMGAFLAKDRVNADKAIAAAYLDIEQAFDVFLENIDPKRPIILAGHSQGALHLITLLNKRIRNTPLTKRIVAVYAIGWPISLETDLAELGMPACQTPEEKGCIISYLTFAEPMDATMVLDAYDATIGLDGRPRNGSAMLCSNPITGIPDTVADASQNIGTLKPSQDFRSGQLFVGKIGARCDPNTGLLLVGDAQIAKDYVVSGYVLPGNNYHVYDITLFWSNIRADVLRRLDQYLNPTARKVAAK